LFVVDFYDRRKFIVSKRFVYADNAATSPISPLILETMLPFLQEGYGNPSSIYTKGREAKAAMEDAREKIARAIGASPDEVYFTSCGTESDNWAIRGAAKAGEKTGKRHIITTNVEHHAVLHTFFALEREGFEATYLPVDKDGAVSAEQVRNAIRPDTALVSVMYANNEIGTVMPITEIAKVCRIAGVLFHTDAVQALGNIPIDVHAQNIDLLALTGHKIRAPKGVGALFVRNGVVLETFMEGGGQEKKRRAGTENVASIVAFGVAAQEAVKNLEKNASHKRAMRTRLIDEILNNIPKSRLNGSPTSNLPSIANISFEGIEGESLLLMLDMQGVCASSGSACTSGSLDPSHVLMAIGLPHEIAHGSLRLSVGEQNTMEDVEYILKVLPGIVERLRFMSPLWEKISKNESLQK
jgi:cysteine desulfurase